VRAEAGLHVPEVRIGSFTSGASGLVPMALRELRSAHPDIRPTLRIVEDAPALDALMTGHTDVTLLIASALNPMPGRPGMATELLLEDPMFVALPGSHPMARQPSIALCDLSDEQWLMTCRTDTCQDSLIVHQACRDAGFEPQVHFESEDYQALLGLTASGMGVTIIPSLAAMSVPADVVVRPIAGETPMRYIHAAWRQGSVTPEVEAALDALRIAGRRLSLSVAPSVSGAMA
jgi:DNA-binding transcriptional LysR family regulator